MLLREIIAFCSENSKKLKNNIKKTVNLCDISSSQSGEYEVQICLLGCTAV
jgi:hypothetical protein